MKDDTKVCDTKTSQTLNRTCKQKSRPVKLRDNLHVLLKSSKFRI